MIKKPHHLVSISDLQTKEIEALLDQSQAFADQMKKGKTLSSRLKDKLILTLFFETSTRTRTSFEIAAKKLGAEVVHWDVASSAMTKEESFLDTIQTLGAMKPDAVIIRHSEYNAPYFVSTQLNCPVINAGDSWRAHPTQALLDALTIRQEKGHIKDLNIAICGDVAHSRVAASNMVLLDKLGAKIRIIAPDFLLPDKLPIDAEKVEFFSDLHEGLPGADIIMTLRIQKERMESSRIPDNLSYFNAYGIDLKHLDLAGPKACVMHPGPMNRNVEISDNAADDPKRSLILKQVANGIPTRMAVLCRALS
jgi:aspartate carbamoyltransferase catalytic subunit